MLRLKRQAEPSYERAPDHPWSSAPAGMVVYAVGDIHGRADLLEALLDKITADRARRPDLDAALVFLGDYVDRGPESDRVLDLVLGVDRTLFEVRTLKGNHESALLAFLEDPASGAGWMRFGGVETLAAYGVKAPRLARDADGWKAAAEALLDRMPVEHMQLLQSLELSAVYGDYFFAHAGARPGTELEAQADDDLLWIRDEFLQDPRAFDKVVVHGHTPEKRVWSDGRRIGVDTGAYATGVLSAVRLQDRRRDLLTASSA